MISPLVIAVAPAVLGVPAEDPRVVAAKAALPAVLGELQRRDNAGRDGDLIAYGGGAGDPVIAVLINRYDKSPDDELTRAMGITVVGRTSAEGWFATDTKPGARGFFGEAVTDKGVQQIWVLQHDGVLTLVKAIIPRVDDRQRTSDLVMRELFSGASMIQTN